MRTLSNCELEMVVGGYDHGGGGGVTYEDNGGGEYTIVATSDMDEATINSIDNAVATMNEDDLNGFANTMAINFGIPVGPFRITPIYNPISGPDSIRYGANAGLRC